MSRQPQSEYTSVRATPELVGRKQEREAIKKAIQKPDKTVIYIRGAGGIGKTRLLQDALEQSFSNQKDILLPSRLVDLYHAANYSVDGLLRNIHRAIDAENKLFKNYLEKRKDLDDYITLHGVSKPGDVQKMRQIMIDAFFADLQVLSDQKRVVILLDTAEKLFYQADPSSEIIKNVFGRDIWESQHVLRWLLHTFIPQMGNALLILAGRPALTAYDLDDTLRTLSRSNAAFYYTYLELKGFNLEEALAYFNKMQDISLKSPQKEDRSVGEQIKKWPQEERQVVFYALCEGDTEPRIRPIILALAIDHLTVGGQPLPAFRYSLADAQRLSCAQREENRKALARALVDDLQKSYRPADEIVIILGWLGKGASAGLLALLMDEDEEKINRGLKHLKNLSFIKRPQGSDRYFLHDEMYRILHEFVLSKQTGPQRERIFKALYLYHRREIERLHVALDKNYVPLADDPKNIIPHSDSAQNIKSRLQTAIVEDLHYRLRWDPLKGFHAFYRYSEEAVLSGDDSLGAQLRAELQAFLAERDPGQTQETIGNLRRAVVKADAAIRRIKWIWRDGQTKDALKLAEELAESYNAVIEEGGPLAQAELKSWQGYLLGGYHNQSQKGIFLLEEAIEILLNWPPERRSVRWAGILGWVYNNLGYVYRVQGNIHQAIEQYEKAIPLLRRARLETQLAITLTNLAFAQALIGELDIAEQQAQEALRLRERLGLLDPMVLNLNVLGLIETKRGNFDRGFRRSSRAYRLAEILEFKRGEGLTLVAMAEARRRQSGGVTARQERTAAQLLAEAAEYAQRAVSIFNKLDELPRRLESLIELGCVYRDWSKLRRDEAALLSDEEKKGRTALTVEELYRQAAKYLDEAIQLAKTEDEHLLQIDALINKSWLIYYTQLTVDNADFEENLRQWETGLANTLEEEIRQHYASFSIASPADILTHPDIWPDRFLVQLGKLDVLKGQIAFNRYMRVRAAADDETTDAALKEGLSYYAQALNFYERFSPRAYFEKRRALNRIYERLSGLRARRMSRVYQLLDQLAAENSVDTTALRAFIERRFGAPDLLDISFEEF